MGSKYDKALARLRAKRMENPDYSAYRQTMQSLAEPVKALNRSTEGSMRMAGGSIGAMAQTGLASQGMLQDMAAQQWGQADRSARARNDVLDTQIGQLEDAKQQEKDANKDAVLKTGLQVGGAALGAAVGTIVAPGAGTMAGMQIGAGLGQAAGSFVGGGGEYGLEHLNEQELIQGLGDAALATSAALTLKSQKKLTTDTVEYIKTNSGDTGKLEGLKLAYLMGQDAVREYLTNTEAHGTLIYSGTVDEREKMLYPNGRGTVADTTQQADTGATVKVEENPETKPDTNVGVGISPKEQVNADAGVGGQIKLNRDEVQGTIANDAKTLAFYTDVDQRKAITDGIQPGEYVVKKDGVFSTNSKGLVAFVNKVPKSVKDVTGVNIKAKLGDTIIVNADGSIEVRSK